jgi:hypothetical protein
MVLKRVFVALAAVTLIVTWTSVYKAPQAAADHCSRGAGTLSGAAINGRTPSGRVEWQGNAICQPLEFRVEVRDVNLPDGTILDVDACPRGVPSNVVGSISLNGGSGRLQLSKLDGDPTNDNVPFCDMRFGDSVKVLRGSTVIVSGCVSDSTGRIPGAPDC